MIEILQELGCEFAVALGRAQKSDIVVVNPAERFGGVAVALVQAIKLQSD